MNFTFFHKSKERQRVSRSTFDRSIHQADLWHRKVEDIQAITRASSAGTPVRRSVALPMEEVSFETPTSRKLKKRAIQIPKKVKKKKVDKTKSAKISFKLTWKKVIWLTFLFVLGRLVFMDRGLIDYYKMEQKILHNHHLVTELMTENQNLRKEIDLIKTNRSYQKKMAREHLGVISQNEFLVLFAQDSH